MVSAGWLMQRSFSPKGCVIVQDLSNNFLVENSQLRKKCTVCSNASLETTQKMTGHKCTTVQLTFIDKTFGAVILSYVALGALETQCQGY